MCHWETSLPIRINNIVLMYLLIEVDHNALGHKYSKQLSAIKKSFKNFFYRFIMFLNEWTTWYSWFSFYCFHAFSSHKTTSLIYSNETNECKFDFVPLLFDAFWYYGTSSSIWFDEGNEWKFDSYTAANARFTFHVIMIYV